MKLREFVDKASEYIKAAWKWVATDGLLHIAFSALIVLAFGWIRPVYGAVIIAFVLGLIKEAYDLKKSGVVVLMNCIHDVICDIIGIVIGLLLVWLNSLA